MPIQKEIKSRIDLGQEPRSKEFQRISQSIDLLYDLDSRGKITFRDDVLENFSLPNQADGKLIEIRVARQMELPTNIINLRNIVPIHRKSLTKPEDQQLINLLRDKLEVVLVEKEDTVLLRDRIWTSTPISSTAEVITRARNLPNTPLTFKIGEFKLPVHTLYSVSFALESTGDQNVTLEDNLRETLGAMFICDKEMLSKIYDNGLVVASQTDNSNAPVIRHLLIPQIVAEKAKLPKSKKFGLYHLSMDSPNSVYTEALNTLANSYSPVAVIATGPNT